VDGVRRITWITEQAFCLTPDDFYRAVDSVIDDSSPRAHMSCDWLENPEVFGMIIFPLAIYRKMEALQDGKHPGS